LYLLLIVGGIVIDGLTTVVEHLSSTRGVNWATDYAVTLADGLRLLVELKCAALSNQGTSGLALKLNFSSRGQLTAVASVSAMLRTCARLWANCYESKTNALASANPCRMILWGQDTASVSLRRPHARRSSVPSSDARPFLARRSYLSDR